VQVAADKFAATAVTVDDARRQKLWDIMAEVWPPYIEYQQKTDRHIPVVALKRG
jgi:deazaflavin-dependent oxidoreductase (nitroreductase family)